jgi:dTDP-4-amino-4,6-dideoxygalactose transaminase
MANPYAVVYAFEETVAEWAGAKYAVAVESGSAAIFLSLMLRKHQRGSVGRVTIPKHTYPSVPCSIIHAGGTVVFSDEPWEGVYELSPLNIWDGALRFRAHMYEEGLHCLSFHVKKHLPIGRGGMILTDDIAERDWLRKARFDGRNPIPLLEDSFDMLGYNMYMDPAQAALGIQLFEMQRNRVKPDLSVKEQGYPDLSQFPIYTGGL